VSSVSYECLCLAVLPACVLALLQAEPARAQGFAIENDHCAIHLDGNGTVTDMLAKSAAPAESVLAKPGPMAWVRIGQDVHLVSRATYAGGRLALEFGELARADVQVTVNPSHIILQVLSVAGDGVDELCFLDIPLSLQGSLDEPFAACALAANLKTNVDEMPGPSRLLQAHCYRRTGFEGARAAIVASPQSEVRAIMQEVVTAEPDLPHSPIGGPWALDGPNNRSSYLFNYDGVSEDSVDQWIATVQSVGFNQVEFHGGSSFRFGDCALSPDRYPDGVASLRRVIDRLHAAGIVAGLHSYAFFIDKRCPYVTPVPDPRLAKDATFTLAQDLAADTTDVPVEESTEAMSTITGFFVHNSVILMVDEELIVFTGVNKQAPFSFTGCQRGALGTTAAPHAKGAKAHHLKECFGLLVPDPETTLFTEVIQRQADLFNQAGFDTIYLDALDGEGILAGNEWAWHYGSRFVFELWQRLDHPAVMEMSTFHHHLWYVRSRTGAWDCPSRSHKQFVDMHVSANEVNDRMFLPNNLGWWAFWNWRGPDGEPTFTDDIEYLCAKAIGTDSGLSNVVYDPANPGHQRLAELTKRYEEVRHAGNVPEGVKRALREPGREFRLVDASPDHPSFRRAWYSGHRVDAADGVRNTWSVENPYDAQAPFIRVETLSAAEAYDSPNAVTVLPADAALLTEQAANAGVTLGVTAGEEATPAGEPSIALTVANATAAPTASWAKAGIRFDPPRNLAATQALGVWIRGDGKGEILNFQLKSPEHITGGIGEHYVMVGFTGWRYIELIETTADDYAHYSWPYGWAYSIYRESVHWPVIEALTVWCNGVPQGESANVLLGPVRAVPLADAVLQSPRVAIGDAEVTFPADIPTGAYLEYDPEAGCRVYGRNGEVIAEVTPQGTARLATGASPMRLETSNAAGTPVRAKVTVGALGPVVE